MKSKMTTDKANKIYDLLVSIGGAPESDRNDFIYQHCESEYETVEYRFCGK
jgi:molybdopterin biosynthesis enzyme